MFSSIMGSSQSRNLTASQTAGSAAASSLSLDPVVADIVTANALYGTLALNNASQFLEEKLRGVFTSRNNCLPAEFAALEALQAKTYNTHYDFTVAVAATELELNRYVDVLPYEHTRVKVINSTASSPTICSTSTSSSFRASPRRKSNSSNKKVQLVKEELATYINASSITCSLNPLLPTSGFDELNTAITDTSWRYIAAQGPLSSTCSTFWEMVLQEKVQSIVMLTDVVEEKRKKCHQYFPLEAETTLQVAPGLKIYTRSVTELQPGLVLRKLEVIKHDSIENNYICDHYHYTGWPDHGVPQSAGPLLLLSYILRTSGNGGGGGNESPIVVHCSAGIGRSGVFCVVDCASRRLVGAVSVVAGGGAGGCGDSANAAAVVSAVQEAVNVKEIVAQLRTQRAGMVQTAEQYVFCHTALLELTRAAIAKFSSTTLAPI